MCTERRNSHCAHPSNVEMSNHFTADRSVRLTTKQASIKSGRFASLLPFLITPVIAALYHKKMSVTMGLIPIERCKAYEKKNRHHKKYPLDTELKWLRQQKARKRKGVLSLQQPNTKIYLGK